MERLSDRVRRVPLPIRTSRLLLGLPRREHVPALVELLAERSVSRWTLHMPYPYRTEDGIEYLARARARRRQGLGLSLQVVRRSDDAPIGGVGLHGLDAEHSSAELGYWIGRPYRRQGYGAEAAAALVTVGFRRLRLHRIEARVFPGNAGSVRLLRRIGFQFEGRARAAVEKQGVWRTELRFARLDTDRVSRPRALRPA